MCVCVFSPAIFDAMQCSHVNWNLCLRAREMSRTNISPWRLIGRAFKSSALQAWSEQLVVKFCVGDPCIHDNINEHNSNQHVSLPGPLQGLPWFCPCFFIGWHASQMFAWEKNNVNVKWYGDHATEARLQLVGNYGASAHYHPRAYNNVTIVIW